MKILLVGFSALLIVMLVWLFMPAEDILEKSDGEQTVLELNEQSATSTEEVATESADNNEEERYEAMKALYADVEKGRRNLKRRLSRLKMVLWDQQLPKEEAEEMQLELMNAYALLKSPRLLGSFRDLEDLEQEHTKLQYALEKVQTAIDTLSDSSSADTEASD